MRRIKLFEDFSDINSKIIKLIEEVKKYGIRSLSEEDRSFWYKEVSPFICASPPNYYKTEVGG